MAFQARKIFPVFSKKNEKSHCGEINYQQRSPAAENHAVVYFTCILLCNYEYEFAVRWEHTLRLGPLY